MAFRIHIFTCFVFVIVQYPVRGDLPTCPAVETVQGLSIEEFTRASWYVQQQQVNSYQRADQLQCVVASYEAGSSGFWDDPVSFEGDLISVYNSYEGGRPTIDAEGRPINRLCAAVKDPNVPSQLSVAPCFLPAFLGGRYWVIGLGTNNMSQYEWAVISGGPPTQHFPDGCTTGTGYFDSGLWIFSRVPILPAEKLQQARQLLTDKGYTLQLMMNVRQEGCTYANSYIKPSRFSQLYSSEKVTFKASGSVALGITAVFLIGFIALLGVAVARKLRRAHVPLIPYSEAVDSELLE